MRVSTSVFVLQCFTTGKKTDKFIESDLKKPAGKDKDDKDESKVKDEKEKKKVEEKSKVQSTDYIYFGTRL